MMKKVYYSPLSQQINVLSVANICGGSPSADIEESHGSTQGGRWVAARKLYI